jgi:hypothetical protein
VPLNELCAFDLILACRFREPTVAQSTIKHPEKLFIDGKWTDPSGASKIDVINSATEELFATVAEAQAPDVNRTVAAARRAFDHGPWPRMSHGERAEYMRALAMELDTLADKHAQIWTTESGVLHSLSKARMSGLSPTYSSYADMAETYQFQERHTPRNGAHVALVVREPVCVVAAIVPWNGAPGPDHERGSPGTGCRLHNHPQSLPRSARFSIYPRRSVGRVGLELCAYDCLRVRFKTSSRITELSQHETNGREFQECEGVSVEIFPVLGEAAATVEPGNGAFDNPTLG